MLGDASGRILSGDGPNRVPLVHDCHVAALHDALRRRHHERQGTVGIDSHRGGVACAGEPVNQVDARRLTAALTAAGLFEPADCHIPNTPPTAIVAAKFLVSAKSIRCTFSCSKMSLDILSTTLMPPVLKPI